jgi:hypothetical protein
MTMSPKNPAAPAPLPGTPLPAFEELKPRLDSGDVLLFGGDSRLSRRIERFTHCGWSHVALVARANASGPPLLWEATLDTDLPDVMTQRIKAGVKLYLLEHWITYYAGETAIRPLQVERTEMMRAALLDFYQEARGRPYEQKRLQIVRAGRRRNRTKDLSSFFCSELVAEAYQRMGLLPPKPPSNNYTPRDFSSERKTPLPLLLGATLGPEVLVCRKAGGPTP